MSDLPSTPTPEARPAASSAGCGTALLVGLALFWIIPVACVRQFSPLTGSALPGDSARIAALTSAIGQVALIGLPLLGFAVFWRTQPFRLIFRTWLLAVVLGALYLPVHLLPEGATQLQTLIQIGVTVIFIGVLAVWDRRRPAAPVAELDDPAGAAAALPRPGLVTLTLTALSLGALLTYPWIYVGALGSLTDLALALLLAFLLGLAAARLIDGYSLRPMLNDPALSRLSVFAYGALSAAGVLAILSGALAYPFGAVQIFTLLSLVGLAGVISAFLLLAPPAGALRRTLPVALLVMLAGGAALAFIDPEEMTLMLALAPGELLPQAFAAAAVSFFLGLVASLFAAVFTVVALRGAAPAPTDGRWRIAQALSLLFLIVLTAGGILLYTQAGQPGLHGDRMFVILTDQADLSAAATIAEPAERRQAVFDALTAHAAASQAELRAGLDRLGADYTPYYLVNALEVADSPAARLWLQSRPEVDRILASPVLRPLREIPSAAPGVPEAPPPTPEWNLTIINADNVWEELGVTGAGILVGQSDSGVQGDHPELADGFRGGADSWFDPWYGTETPTDIGGHGTHTLGSVLGNHVGVAPDAQWIACVNLARNLGNPALYLDCWQFNLAPFPLGGNPWQGDPARGAQVLNNSWGCPEIEGCDMDTFAAAVGALRAAGVFVVVSAGNDGPTCSSLNVPPPTYDEVLSVGAIDSQGGLAFFSSRGPVTGDGSGRVKPDLVAPGQDVFSSLPGSAYGSNSGTSMAGPHVVGVVALMWSANPDLIGDIDRTEQILFETAAPYTGSLPDCPGASNHPSTAVGYGVVDAFAAVQAAQNLR